jgi:hypothetical protein
MSNCPFWPSLRLNYQCPPSAFPKGLGRGYQGTAVGRLLVTTNPSSTIQSTFPIQEKSVENPRITGGIGRVTHGTRLRCTESPRTDRYEHGTTGRTGIGTTSRTGVARAAQALRHRRLPQHVERWGIIPGSDRSAIIG